MFQRKKSKLSDTVLIARKIRSNYGRVLRAAVSFPILGVSVLPGLSRAEPLDLGSFNDLALRCGPTVAPSTLAAVAKTESGFEPFASLDNTTGKSHTYQSVEQAAPVIEHLIDDRPITYAEYRRRARKVAADARIGPGAHGTEG